MRKMCVVIFVSFFMAACGGGGGSSTGGGTPAITSSGFSYSDFAGKTVYYVSKGYYQGATFNTDGTVRDESGQSQATWTIVGTTLRLANQSTSEILNYNLISHDTANRYYRVQKDSTQGDTVVIGMFYDQTTGLSQAKYFATSGALP